MTEKEELIIDINSLNTAYIRIKEALKELVDVEIFSEEDYIKLEDMAEKINDLRIRKESEWECKYE